MNDRQKCLWVWHRMFMRWQRDVTLSMGDFVALVLLRNRVLNERRER